VPDAVRKRLRIPYETSSWEKWAQDCDRLTCMSSFRFFNFLSRPGMNATEATIRFLADRLVRRTEQDKPAVHVCVTTFFKRKICKADKGAQAKKEEAFREEVVRGLQLVLGADEGRAWYNDNINPVYEALK